MAHKDAQDTFNRHFQFWQKLGDDIMVVYPSDAKVDLPERGRCIPLEVGKASHTGIQSIVRFRTVLEQMNGAGYDRCAFFEYDAICLGGLPEQRAPIMAPVFRDNGPNRGFIGTMFCHPPLIFSRHGLAVLCEEIKQMPMTAEGSVWDRWFGLAVERTGLPVFDLLEAGLAFAENTIHPARYADLAKAVRNGCHVFHGIKSPETLQVVLNANILREAAKTVVEGGGEVKWRD